MDDPVRCWCCGVTMTIQGSCPLCDMPSGPVSPPHVCVRSGQVIGDEHSYYDQDGIMHHPCADPLAAIPADHEVRPLD